MAIPNFEKLLDTVIAGNEFPQWFSYVLMNSFTDKEIEIFLATFKAIIDDKSHVHRNNVLFLCGNWHLLREEDALGIGYLDEAANAGNFNAMAFIAERLTPEKGKPLLNKAITEGKNSYAMFVMASKCEGEGNHEEGKKYLKLAADHGNTFAMIDLAEKSFTIEMLKAPGEHESQIKGAIAYYDKAIALNDMMALHLKGMLLKKLSYSDIPNKAFYRTEAIKCINHMVQIQHPHGLSLKAMFLLDEQFYTFSRKGMELNSRNEEEAIKAATTLREELLEATKNLFESASPEEKFPEFKNKADKLIQDAERVLSKHRGWSEFFVNLALTITVIGILIKGAINIANNRSFFFVHETDSSKKLREFSEKFHAIDFQGELKP